MSFGHLGALGAGFGRLGGGASGQSVSGGGDDFVWPSAADTGAQRGPYTGTTLTTPEVNGDGNVVVGAGEILEGIHLVGGTIIVVGDNATIRNCLVETSNFNAVDGRNAGLTIEYCTFIGPGMAGDCPAVIALTYDATVTRCDVSGGEHGIMLGAGEGVITENYIHDGGSNKEDVHMGGISLKGGQDGVLIKDNYVNMGSLGTSDIFLQNNFGPINDATIEHNYMDGDPGYCLYVEGRLSGGLVTNISVVNNVMKQGHYGYVSVDTADPTFSGNVDENGNPISLP
jgi:hypothetical protein